MQSDRELLGLAAKAAAIETVYWNDGREPYSSGLGFILPSNRLWNPLDDDGDALRLAVKLRISVAHWKADVSALHPSTNREFPETCASCPYAATRRAIVRAAAELGAQAHADHKDGGAVYG
jgi:hypothetical protein